MHSRGVGRGPEVKHSQKSPCASADGLGMAVAVVYVLVEVGCECNSCVLSTVSLTKGTKVKAEHRNRVGGEILDQSREVKHLWSDP